MKPQSYLFNKIRAVQQPSWLKPALMTLALAVTILGVSGCSDSNDSHGSNHPGNNGDHGNHGNHGNHMN